MKSYIKKLCCVVALLATAGIAQAVLVENYSFEADANGTPLAPTGWTWNNAGDGGSWTGGGTEGAGPNNLTLGNGAAVSQTLGETIVLGTEYQATVDARSSWWGVLAITLYSDDGVGGLVDLATTSFDPGVDVTGFAPLSVSYTTVASDVDKNLGVRLSEVSGGSNNWSEWDNVTVEAIPEPATLGLLGIAAVSALVIRRKFMI